MPNDIIAKSKANIAPALIDIKKNIQKKISFLIGFMIPHQSIQIQLCLPMEKIQFYQYMRSQISLIIFTLYEEIYISKKEIYQKIISALFLFAPFSNKFCFCSSKY